MIQIVIHGAAGRMGQRLVALAAEDEQLHLTGAVEQPGHPLLGKDAGLVAGREPLSLPLTGELPQQGVDVVIDFSAPIATRAVLEHCAACHQALVIGTTGLGPADQAAIDQAAKHIAVLQAPNMSLGVNLLFALAGQAARQLGDDYDIEIVETHHRFKKDAPSGTALGIAQAICQATGKNMNRDLIYGRHGQDVPRQRGQIGLHAIRSGDVIGRHTVSFGTLGEELQLTHIATNRDVFVRGALRAAKWLFGRQPGRYGMINVLGLT